jgi:GTPase SAR1 family protein
MEIYLEENIPKILVGNKNDDNNQENKIVLTSDGKELAEQNKFLFFETSVKDNKNINEVFNRMTKLVLKRRIAQIKKQPNNIPIVVNPSMISKSKESNKSCCSV